MTGASPPPPASQPQTVFDRGLHAKRRTRAAGKFDDFAFLKDRAVDDIIERLEAIPRPFQRTLDLGAHDGRLGKSLATVPDLASRLGDVFSSDLSPAFLSHHAGLPLAADEEWLPFKPKSFDCILSALSLHWVNDLPGALVQIRQALSPDGLFIGQMIGGASLHELRSCLMIAETEIRGGAAMRVSPFADVTDISALLQRAGFVLPVADTDTVTVRYTSPFRLLQDLRGMGEANAPAQKTPPLTRAILFRAMELYAERHSDKDGKVIATFEMITASGWSPGPNQPKPLKPGSAKSRLADALGVTGKSAETED